MSGNHAQRSNPLTGMAIMQIIPEIPPIPGSQPEPPRLHNDRATIIKFINAQNTKILPNAAAVIHRAMVGMVEFNFLCLRSASSSNRDRNLSDQSSYGCCGVNSANLIAASGLVKSHLSGCLE